MFGLSPANLDWFCSFYYFEKKQQQQKTRGQSAHQPEEHWLRRLVCRCKCDLVYETRSQNQPQGDHKRRTKISHKNACKAPKTSPWQGAWRSRWAAGVSPHCYLTSCDKTRLDIWIAVPGTARSPLLPWQMLQLVTVMTANCWHGFASPTHLHQVCVFFGRKWLAYVDTQSPMESGQSQRQLCPRQNSKLQSKYRLHWFVRPLQ